MDLIHIRELFKKLSGRHDLVNDDYSDSGVDFFINEGRKYLDRMDETQKTWATRFAPLALGEISVTFPYCRAIKEVWATSATDGRWQMEKKDLQDLMNGYLLTLPAEMGTGVPVHYAPAITRSVPMGVTPASHEESLGYIQVSNSDYNALLLNVPTSAALTLIIHGLFYSPELTADDDINYWSEVHPMLLYMSTMRQIEIVNRSTQGVNDWSASIALEMKQLGMDLVEELISEVSQMEG